MPAKTISVRNPRTGENDFEFEQISARELEKICAALRRAQNTWLAAGIESRIDALQKLKASINKHRQFIVDALCADTGRLTESELEVSVILSAIDRWCELAPGLLKTNAAQTTSIPFIEVGKQLVPYPVVGMITPWNFPLLLSCIDTLPALLAGSAVVVKPSEITPRFVTPFQKCINEVSELESVFRFVPGDGEVGSALLDNIDVVCFTGSVATGRKIAEAAAKNFIPSHLELGGKDPAIVTAQADLERAAAAISWGGLANAGQSCLSIERIYVEDSVHDDFLAHLVNKTKALLCNTSDIADGQIGPVISNAQLGIIQSHLDDAFTKGAVAECGGKIERHNGGSWCLPTVLSQVTKDMKVMREETFAAILPVARFDSEEQAIELANDSQYGLSAAVFSNDEEQAQRIAGHLQAGAISINDAALTAIMHEGEKQAFKHSGLGGSRMGPVSIMRFVKSKAMINNAQKVWDPWWFDQK